MTRDEILNRYRHLRAISAQHHGAALDFVSRDAIMGYAKRIGLASGKFLIADSEEMMTLIFDLALYTAKEGRSRALDRYARASPPAAGSDEARVLDAMRQARFSLWRVERRHETAGLIVMDMLRWQEAWLMDESLEAHAPGDMTFASRVFEPESFVMTCGNVVPLTAATLAQLTLDPLLSRRHGPEDLAQDPRLAEKVYRLAIDSGIMDQVVYQ